MGTLQLAPIRRLCNMYMNVSQLFNLPVEADSEGIHGCCARPEGRANKQSVPTQSPFALPGAVPVAAVGTALRYKTGLRLETYC